MNGLVVGAGLVSAFTTIGHFVIGTKEYLTPMLSASFDPVPKKVMHSVFHYASVFLTLSTLALLAVGLEIITDDQPSLLVRFIAATYVFFAVWQIVIAVTSEIERALTKMFQWVIFIIIAVLAWLGA